MTAPDPEALVMIRRYTDRPLPDERCGCNDGHSPAYVVVEQWSDGVKRRVPHCGRYPYASRPR